MGDFTLRLLKNKEKKILRIAFCLCWALAREIKTNSALTSSQVKLYIGSKHMITLCIK